MFAYHVRDPRFHLIIAENTNFKIVRTNYQIRKRIWFNFGREIIELAQFFQKGVCLAI